MPTNQIHLLHMRLCTLCVFRNLLEQPLFRQFLQYAEQDENAEQKLMSYSGFVNAIYAQGGSLTDCIRKAVFEDENVYITAYGREKPCDSLVRESVERELDILSDFAALTPQDFAKDMNVELSLPAFHSQRIDLSAQYAERIANVQSYGYGIFASAGMFRLSDGTDPRIEPLSSADPVSMDSFIGYHEERARVLANTEAFVEGRPAANVLLYGDAGTGKSSTVKAVANHLFSRGVRLIELRKNQMEKLPYVMEKISGNPLKFIIFIDDLSFGSGDDSFSMLKAALEGSASAKAPNAVIYATSNRRHIVQESFRDREGGDVHRNDTMQELLSLSARFGLTVQFGKPDKKLYLEIVRELAQKHRIEIDVQRLETEAEAFALRRGYRSARCAEQYINSLL